MQLCTQDGKNFHNFFPYYTSCQEFHKPRNVLPSVPQEGNSDTANTVQSTCHSYLLAKASSAPLLSLFWDLFNTHQAHKLLAFTPTPPKKKVIANARTALLLTLPLPVKYAIHAHQSLGFRKISGSVEGGTCFYHPQYKCGNSKTNSKQFNALSGENNTKSLLWQRQDKSKIHHKKENQISKPII